MSREQRAAERAAQRAAMLARVERHAEMQALRRRKPSEVAVIAAASCETCSAALGEGCRFGGERCERTTRYVHAVRRRAYLAAQATK